MSGFRCDRRCNSSCSDISRDRCSRVDKRWNCFGRVIDRMRILRTGLSAFVRWRWQLCIGYYGRSDVRKLESIGLRDAIGFEEEQ
ncbi:hypothetical protein GOBAR_DD34052 [Gossypium barbadense]|nr:hypothetical protein GOBAR_DD34052 [Gossypium barbadense]